MSFKSLSHILRVLENQLQSPEQLQFQRLLKCWPEVVGVRVISQTKLLSFQRGVLRVATSSSAWAQTLTLERRRILEKLNPLLPTPVVDIRFSVAGWSEQKNNSSSPADVVQPLTPEHPSRLQNDTPKPSKMENPQHPHDAFQSWAETLQKRSQSLPLCQNCQCPTPPGELQRWSVCALCATKAWRNDSPGSR